MLHKFHLYPQTTAPEQKLEAQRGKVSALGVIQIRKQNSLPAPTLSHSILLAPPGSTGSDVNCYREALPVSSVAGRRGGWYARAGNTCTLLSQARSKGQRQQAAHAFYDLATSQNSKQRGKQLAPEPSGQRRS